jgi:hypothetical protein
LTTDKAVFAIAIGGAHALRVAIFATFTVSLSLRVHCQFDSLSRLNQYFVRFPSKPNKGFFV